LEGEAVERLLSVAGSLEIADVSADLRAVDRPYVGDRIGERLTDLRRFDPAGS
jgi:hypothetical protein